MNDQRDNLFFRLSGSDDYAEELIKAAFDPAVPDYLRAELIEILSECISECFPELKPSDYDANNLPIYATKEIARTLGESQDSVHAAMTNLTSMDCSTLQ